MKHKKSDKLMNGNILNTLRDMANRERLDPEVAQPMILGVLADIYQAVCELRDERESDLIIMENNRETYKAERLEQLKLIEQTNLGIKELNEKIKTIENALIKIDQNPAIKVGWFTANHPKITKLLVVIGIITMFVLAVPGIKLWLLSDILNLPDVVIDFLMTYPTPIPIIK